MSHCHHGNPKNRCRLCELEAEINRLASERDQMLVALEQAQAVLAKGTHLGGSVAAFQQYRSACDAIDAVIANAKSI